MNVSRVLRLTRENIPVWYQLDLDIQTMTILVWTGMDVWKELCDLLESDCERINRKSQELRLADFIFPTVNLNNQTSWGFGGCANASLKGNVIEIAIPLPGSGPEAKVKGQQIDQVVGTLSKLFYHLYCCKATGAESQDQLLAVMLGDPERFHMGSGIKGFISPKLAAWIGQKCTLSLLRQIRDAMWTTWAHLNGPTARSEFFASIAPPDQLTLGVPGSECNLKPSGFGTEPGSGYEMITHNLDGVSQQLSLLAGLLTLYKLARQ